LTKNSKDMVDTNSKDIGSAFLLEEVGRWPVDDEKIRLFTQVLTVADQGSGVPVLYPECTCQVDSLRVG
jgi:hypothetical protein